MGHPGFGHPQLKPRTNHHFISPTHRNPRPSPQPAQQKREASDLKSSTLRRRVVRVQRRAEEMAASEGVLLGMGNPLLDISAVVDDAFLSK